jgi:serine/threonine-protein kinase
VKTGRWLVACVLVSTALCLSGGRAAAQSFGAISYSPSTGAFGWTKDYSTRAEAERVAIANCRKQANDCTSPPLWFRNACGALAVGSGGWGTAWGFHQADAEKKAITSCQRWSMDCVVKHSLCTAR